MPGAWCASGHEYRIASVDCQIDPVRQLEGDATFDQVHQFMQQVRPRPAGIGCRIPDADAQIGRLFDKLIVRATLRCRA